MYIEQQLFKRLGIEDQVKAKAKMIPKIPVASVVATGDYELGFQQVSELLPVPGVSFVGEDSGVGAVGDAFRRRYSGGRATSGRSEGVARLSRLARRSAGCESDRAGFGQSLTRETFISTTSRSSSNAAGVNVRPRRLIKPTLRITCGSVSGTRVRIG